MHEWRHDAFAALRTARAEAAEEPLWTEFAAYCDLRERGLRREAFQRLERFVDSIGNADFEERRRFICWFLPQSDLERNSGYLLRPESLDRSIVLPTLREWIERAPDDPQPLIWLGSEDDVRLALKLSPHHPEASVRLAALLLHDAHYAMHELPWGLLGDPAGILSQVVEAGAHLQHASVGSVSTMLGEAQASSERLIRSYADYLKSAERVTGETFQSWAAAAGRPSRLDYGLPPRWRIIGA